MLKEILYWIDGDSGYMAGADGVAEEFRMSNVSSPERLEPGYRLARTRANRAAPIGSVVDVEESGKDTFGRMLVVMKKNGKDVNKKLERQNKLYK